MDFNKSPLSEKSVEILYSANNINFELCDLFSDFTQSLLCLIFDTYLGDNVMTYEDKSKHFEWCWNKNIENFEVEGIYFNNDKKCFEYFQTFMFDVFYEVNNKTVDIETTIKILWIAIFSYTKGKNKTNIKKFFKIYTMLEKSLKNSKKS